MAAAEGAGWGSRPRCSVFDGARECPQRGTRLRGRGDTHAIHGSSEPPHGPENSGPHRVALASLSRVGRFGKEDEIAPKLGALGVHRIDCRHRQVCETRGSLRCISLNRFITLGRRAKRSGELDRPGGSHCPGAE